MPRVEVQARELAVEVKTYLKMNASVVLKNHDVTVEVAWHHFQWW